MPEDMSVNEFTDEEIKELFGDLEQTTPAANDTPIVQSTPTQSVDQTKAFSKRLREERDKERQKIARTLGYDTYEALIQAQQDKMLADKGINPASANPVIEQIVEQKIASDPRMLELNAIHQQQAEAFAKTELKSLSELVGQEFNSLEDVPEDVIEDWKTSGSIKQSYIKLHGEELIRKTRKAVGAGTTQHMQSTGTGSDTSAGDTRLLTDKEKAAWRAIFPNMTQEELDKKTVKR